jgi:PAS domain S-box-containing protein
MSALLDSARLAAVAASGIEPQVSATEPSLVRAVVLARRLLAAPYAFVSIIDDAHVHVCAADGFAPGMSVPHAQSICPAVVESGAPLLIRDVSVDPRWSAHPACAGGVAAYAGVPLHAADGQVIGTLCAGDVVAREFGDEDASALAALAASIETELRLRAERRALRESEARFRDVTGTIQEVFWVIGADRTVLYVSPAFEELWGRPCSELVGGSPARVLDFVHEDDRVHAQVAFMSGWHAPGVVTYRMVRPDGTVRWIEDRFGPVRDEHGKVVRVVGAASDVTARRAAEDRLRDSERRFRTIIESASSPVAIVDAEGTIVYASPAHERVLGWSREELEGASCFARIHPDDVPLVQELVGRIAQEPGASVDFCARHLDREGRYRTMIASAKNLLEDPAIGGIVVNSRDVTAQALAEEALRESEARHRMLFEASPVPMWLFDVESLRFLAVNDAAIVRYGYSREEFLARTILDIRPPEDREATIALARTPASRLRSSGIHRHLWKDGTVREVEVTIHDVELEGRPARMVLALDVTERLRAEAALRESEAALRQSQKMEAIGQLAGGVAHDFNNLVTAIKLHAELLLESFEAIDPRREDVDEICRAATRASSLTRQLLAFSRKQLLKPRILDPNQTITDVARMLGRLLGEHISIKTDLARDLGSVLADPGQLEQVLVNLAVNARDAMPAGGTLRIATRNVQLGGEDTVEGATGAHVSIEVEDTGIGIDPAIMPRIFEPFFTTKELGRGTGLGLSTVYGIVKQSGGQVTVRSTVGHGSTFRIYLPISASSSRSVRPSEGRASGGHETILLVEDETGLRVPTRRILEREGYEVLEAANGREALERAEHFPRPIDLLITDAIMPEMGGAELIAALRGKRPGTRVLMVSGYSEDVLLRRDEAVQFLAKPFQSSDLLRRIREVLAQPSGARQPQRASAPPHAGHSSTSHPQA